MSSYWRTPFSKPEKKDGIEDATPATTMVTPMTPSPITSPNDKRLRQDHRGAGPIGGDLAAVEHDRDASWNDSSDGYLADIGDGKHSESTESSLPSSPEINCRSRALFRDSSTPAAIPTNHPLHGLQAPLGISYSAGDVPRSRDELSGGVVLLDGPQNLHHRRDSSMSDARSFDLDDSSLPQSIRFKSRSSRRHRTTSHSSFDDDGSRRSACGTLERRRSAIREQRSWHSSSPETSSESSPERSLRSGTRKSRRHSRRVSSAASTGGGSVPGYYLASPSSSEYMLMTKNGRPKLHMLAWTLCVAALTSVAMVLIMDHSMLLTGSSRESPIYTPVRPNRSQTASGLRGTLVLSSSRGIVLEEDPEAHMPKPGAHKKHETKFAKSEHMKADRHHPKSKTHHHHKNKHQHGKEHPTHHDEHHQSHRDEQQASDSNNGGGGAGGGGGDAPISRLVPEVAADGAGLVGAVAGIPLLDKGEDDEITLPSSPLVITMPPKSGLSSHADFDSVDPKLYARTKRSRRVVSLDVAFGEQPPSHRRIKVYKADFTDNTQLYPILESDDERLNRMEIREPYSNEECVPMQPWQVTYNPSCNGMHEMGFDSNIGEEDGDYFELFGTKGFWRYAWRYDTLGDAGSDKKESIVFKNLKYGHNFEDAHFEHDRIDAVAMERLTASPHVINIFGFCGHSVLTEYAEGTRVGALADKAAKTPLARLSIARDIANGLADVHGIDGDAEGNSTFVHLDINPANVVSINGTLKLNDFNIGIIRRWNVTSNKPCGFPAQYPNPQWRSPEEARNEQFLTEKVDVFSMGHIFFRLICGHEPWNKLEPGGKPEKEVINEKVQKGVLPTIPDDVMNSDDPEVIAIRDVMLKCYSRQPAQRPSARSIANELQQKLDELSAAAVGSSVA